MTIIVGVDSFTEAIVIADSRVSWGNNQHPPQDILRKLYPIRGPENKFAVLGFSGYLETANLVMQVLIKKLRYYKRPFIMVHLKDDIGRWIEEIAKSVLPAEKRTRVKFMLCGIEANRHPPIMKNGKVVGYLPFVEVHVYTYSISESGNVYYNLHRTGYEVIGSGKKAELEILLRIQEIKRFGFNQPNLHWARAVVMGEFVASEISKDAKLAETVGGPFQVIRVTPDGLENHYVWPVNQKPSQVDVDEQDEKTVILNLSTRQKAILLPIWRLFPSQLSGAG